MVTPRLRRALTFSLCFALVAPAASAQPRPDERPPPSKQDLDEAQRRYKRGLDLFNEGQYDASMLEFRKANELAPSYKILYNIGQVNRQLNDYARAVEAFDRYLREGGTNVPAARAAEVQKELEKLRQRVARVEVTSNVAGAEVSVDDLSFGRTPFAQPLLVNAGRRKLTATAEGRPAITRVIEVAGAESVRVPLDFVEVPETRPAGPGATPPPITIGSPNGGAVGATAGPDAGSERRVPWLAWGVTGALAAGAGVSGILALQAKSHYEEHQDSTNTTRAELDEANDKARNLGIVTDVLIGATAIAAGVSLYLTLAGGGEKDSAPSAKRAPGPWWGVGVGPGYLGARGAF